MKEASFFFFDLCYNILASKERIKIFINDFEYNSITNDILNNQEFLKTKNIVHHSLNRFDHSVRVSYYSYKIAKFLRLDYESVARGGLLHDFFLVDNKNITLRERAFTLVNHPKYSLNYSLKFFDLNDKEKNIIVSHMFPVCPIRIPKYLESWIVDIVDDVISIKEEIYANKRKFARSICMIIAFLFFIK